MNLDVLLQRVAQGLDQPDDDQASRQADDQVIDVTGAEPKVLREGAVPAAEALERLAAAVS